MPSGVKVENLNKTVRALQEFGVEIADLKDVFSGIARDGADLASRYAPVRSGRLVKSIRGNKAKNKAVVTAGKARVPYAGAINYGWRRKNITATLFMQRADAAMQPRALKLLDDGLQQAINKTGLKE